MPIQEKEWRESLRAVLGVPLVGVDYLVSGGARWPDKRVDRLVNEVGHGVRLIFADHKMLSLVWEMNGEDELLAISSEALQEQISHGLIDIIDVSNVPEWSKVLGHPVLSVRASWHIPNSGRPRFVWALRFDIESGPSFVVALGEIQEAHAVYLPDSVVVLFSREDAEAYRPLSAVDSAWNGDLVGTLQGGTSDRR